MSEWKKVKLGECCEITSSKRIFLSDYVPVGIPFYRSKEIAEMQKGESISDPLFISNDKYEEIKCKFGIPQKGDLLLTAIGATLGIPFVIKNNLPFYFKDGNLIWFKNFNDLLDSSFLYSWMCSSFGYQSMQNIAIGSAQKALTISALKDLSLIVPPIDIQHRIATILSRYDSLIENYQKQIKLLEEAAQRLYKEWFVDLHFPGHENVKIVDGVPEGWEKKTLGELFSYVRGKSYSSNEISDEGCIMVNLKNIQAFGGYKRDAEKRFIGKYKPEQTLQKGDLVMGVTDMTQERRLVGHVALIPDFNEPATFSMDLIKIIPYSVPIIYLYCAMRYGGISKQISPLANGVNVLHLKPDTILGTMMVVPRKDLIERFCPFVEEMTNKILKNQSQVRLLTEARDRLLPKLMSGEIEI